MLDRTVDNEEKDDTHYYGVPRVNLKDDLNYILNHAYRTNMDSFIN